MISESAYLELDTFSLAGTSDMNSSRTEFTFRNIDLRNVMGAMWDKYDKFSLKVQSRYSLSPAVNSGGSQFNIIQTQMKGLSWINCFNEISAPGNQYIPILTANVTNSAVAILPINAGYAFNFRKSSPIVDLSFIITISQNTSLVPASTNPAIITYGFSSYTFLIEPAENNQNEMGFMALYTNPALTNYKVISQNEKVYEYFGFDMRNVCTEFWHKYEDYEIVLASVQQQGYTCTDEQSLMVYQMSGFNWTNNLSKQASNSYVNQNAIVGFFRSGETGSDHRYNVFNEYSPVQFKKSGDTINMRLEIRNYDNSGINGLTTSPNRRSVLSFFIRPIKKDLNPEKATLTLNSNGLTTTATQLGIRNSNWTDITLNNINLKSALGTMWDKYEKFNVFFTGLCSTSVNNTANNPINNLFVNLKCEGFSTDTQYNAKITSQTWNIGAICTYDGGSTLNPRPSTYGNCKSTTFYKNKENVDIRLYLENLNSSQTVFLEALNGCFTFTIVGVE